MRIKLTGGVPIAIVVLLSCQIGLAAPGSTRAKTSAPSPTRMKGAHRVPLKSGWLQVHLEGNASDIGYQHGYLLAPEIADTRRTVAASLEHDTMRPWPFFRKAAEEVLWPHIETEYREELQGIADGLNAHGVRLDLWDVVALNAWLELGAYYVPWLDRVQHNLETPGVPVPERCSAFIATGSFTSNGEIVIAHNAWAGYPEGARWNIVFDLRPERGHRILMDGMAGMIHSGDDFGINSGGLMITETTISHFAGFDPNGVAEFVRARKAMQYADSIDSFVRIMTEGNNGGYANNWLIGDRKTGEIASLELGLKNVTLQRTTDGYFAGANFPVSEKLLNEETTFSAADPAVSANARRLRWDQLMREYKGKIDIPAAKSFLADHWDAYEGKIDPNERTLCGHIELSPRGLKGWTGPYGLAGTVQAKAATSATAEKMSFEAAMGHPCGLRFSAKTHLRKHPQTRWATPILKDIASESWTVFSIAR